MSPRTEVTFDGFVHVEGGALLDGRGRPILMRGVGLGNWLLAEGYMWRFPAEGPQSARQIEALIADLVGEAAADAFWREFRARFIDEADIVRIAAEGFDHVRLPLNSRTLIRDDGALLEAGFEPIDRLVEWCRRHGLWVVLDLHGAPGGQTGTNIDDSPHGRPDLFIEGGRYREQTIALWTAIARRYRDETVVVAFDLLNEPLPSEWGDRFPDRLVSLYRELTEAVRTVDPNHLMTYEGTHWATDWSIFTESPDPNSMLQFHKYWSAPDGPSVARFLEVGRRLGLPVYMGEGGENEPAWLQTAFALYEDLGISWNFWPWKKMETWSSPASVTAPGGWGEIVKYAAGSGPKPTAERARTMLDGLLSGVRLDQCEYRSVIVDSLFHRVPIRLAAEAFGFHGCDRSWHTTAATPLPAFRPDDAVTIRPLDDREAWDHEDGAVEREPRFEVVLDRGDWVAYSIDVTRPAILVVVVRSRVAGEESAAFRVALDRNEMRSEAVAGERRWLAAVSVGPGGHVLRVEAAADGAAFYRIDVTEASPIAPAAGGA